MNIIRQGAKNLIIESDQVGVTYEKILDLFDCEFSLDKEHLTFKDYSSLISLVKDRMTIIMLTEKMKAQLTFKDGDFKYIIAIKMDCEDVLIELIKNKEAIDIKNIRTTPRVIIMRTTGDANKFIETVKKDAKGQAIAKNLIFEKYGQGSFIFFTDESISSPIGLESFHDTVVYSEIKVSKLIHRLNNNRVKYVSSSIDHKDWAELTIKIYDSYENYELQYRRLILVLEEMNCGLILGEGWGRDAALTFHSVGVYQLRLFTYLDPKEVKKILLGLEYNQKRKRIVDYDLFSKKKKIYWTNLREKRNQDRDELGLSFRNDIFEHLNEALKVKLLALELQIEKETY